MHYQIDIYPKDPRNPSSWRGEVGFGYRKRKLREFNYSEDDCLSLENTIQSLDIHANLKDFSGGQQRKVAVVLDSENTLEDDLAKLLSDSLRPFIEVITPAIDEFEDERINQESAQ